MKSSPPFHGSLWFFLAALVPASVSSAAVIDVTPGNNNAPISQVTYLIGGLDVVQTTEAAGVEHTGDTPVNLKSVRITDGASIDLPFFNTADAVVRNVNPQLATKTGVGVFDNGTTTTSTAGAAFETAVAGTAKDTDLRNFSFQDFVSPAVPAKTGFDYDILFKYALNLEDYLLISERWGNSSCLVTALDINGNPYTTSNTLRFGGAGLDTGLSYAAYDWTTGYSSASNVPDQAQALMVASVSRFFTNPATGGPVYGVRVEIPAITTGPDIQGEADTKIVGLSANTFADNSPNPLVPETSSLLMAVLGGALFAGSRKRTKRADA